MADLFEALLRKRNPSGTIGPDKVPDMETITDAGAARSTDPSTSKDAARSIHASDLEQLVLGVLRINAPMTAEEVALKLGKMLQTITPRFAPLCDKRMIEKIMTPDGYEKRRSKTTKRLRLVYRFQSDVSLWQSRPKKPNAQARIRALEETVEVMVSVFKNDSRLIALAEVDEPTREFMEKINV